MVFQQRTDFQQESGHMNIDPQVAMAVIAGAAAIATAIWHAGLYIGKLTVRIDSHGTRLDQHDKRLDAIESER